MKDVKIQDIEIKMVCPFVDQEYLNVKYAFQLGLDM
jgi:hypothetical protein